MDAAGLSHPPSSFRRSSNLSPRSPRPSSEHGDSSYQNSLRNDAIILYSHPEARIVRFPHQTGSRPSSSSGAWNASPGTLPWASKSERTIAAGLLSLQQLSGRQNVTYVHSGPVLLTFMQRSQWWCVDGVSKFINRMPNSTVRIELPHETEDDLAMIERFKEVLSQVFLYERTQCPFDRHFKIELLEEPDLNQPMKVTRKSSYLGRNQAADARWRPDGSEDINEVQSDSNSPDRTDEEDNMSIRTDDTRATQRSAVSPTLSHHQEPRKSSLRSVADHASLLPVETTREHFSVRPDQVPVQPYELPRTTSARSVSDVLPSTRPITSPSMLTASEQSSKPLLDVGIPSATLEDILQPTTTASMAPTEDLSLNPMTETQSIVRDRQELTSGVQASSSEPPPPQTLSTSDSIIEETTHEVEHQVLPPAEITAVDETPLMEIEDKVQIRDAPAPLPAKPESSETVEPINDEQPKTLDQPSSLDPSAVRPETTAEVRQETSESSMLPELVKVPEYVSSSQSISTPRTTSSSEPVSLPESDALPDAQSDTPVTLPMPAHLSSHSSSVETDSSREGSFMEVPSFASSTQSFVTAPNSDQHRSTPPPMAPATPPTIDPDSPLTPKDDAPVLRVRKSRRDLHVPHAGSTPFVRQSKQGLRKVRSLTPDYLRDESIPWTPVSGGGLISQTYSLLLGPPSGLVQIMRQIASRIASGAMVDSMEPVILNEKKLKLPGRWMDSDDEDEDDEEGEFGQAGFKKMEHDYSMPDEARLRSKRSKLDVKA